MKRQLRLAGRLGSWAVLAAAVALMGSVLALTAGSRLVGWQGLVVQSGSMEPHLKVGGFALVELSDSAQARPGDIITYRSVSDPSKRISHRVIEVINDGGALSYRTKGDASPGPDPNPVPAENVVGKVRAHVPYVGYVVRALGSSGGFVVLIALPALLAISSEVWNLARTLAPGQSARGAKGGGEP